jgi:predicted nucleic acid-binding protein
LSLIDCSSFVFMRRSGIRRAFSFDRDFKHSGFELL